MKRTKEFLPEEHRQDEEARGSSSRKGRPHRVRESLTDPSTHAGSGDNYPNQDFYVKSYMHRDTCSHLLLSPVNDFLISASVDGHIKFWKILDRQYTSCAELEFVKDYRAHTSQITCLQLNKDCKLLASIARADMSLKIFHVLSFDMICMIRLDFEPAALCFSGNEFLVISDCNSNAIYVYDSDSFSVLFKDDTLHKSPVSLLAGHPSSGLASLDATGFLELSVVEYDRIRNVCPPEVEFTSKLDTDLYCLLAGSAQRPAVAGVVKTIRFSPNGKQLVLSTDKGDVVVFKTSTCTINTIIHLRELILEDLSENHIEKTRRNIVEEDFLRNSGLFSIAFDDFNNNLVLPSGHGIVVLDLSLDRPGSFTVLSRAGFQESLRFNHVVLWTEKHSLTSDCHRPSDRRIYALAWKKNRLYAFTNCETSSVDYDRRDVCNEQLASLVGHHGDQHRLIQAFTDHAPKTDQVSRSCHAVGDTGEFSTEGVIHTTLGDIAIVLYPQQCPKTVENFCGLSKKGYYNGNIFHRVIRQFMIQTGDPAGTGAGGQSLWGSDFNDEIVDDLKHDKPYTLSMANAGPNTNGSQFFITVVSCPWLDGKHTIFGRVVKGMDVVHRINNLKTDKHDKPLDEAKILSVTVK